MSTLNTIVLNVNTAFIVAACRTLDIVLPSSAWAWQEAFARAAAGGIWV